MQIVCNSRIVAQIDDRDCLAFAVACHAIETNLVDGIRRSDLRRCKAYGPSSNLVAELFGEPHVAACTAVIPLGALSAVGTSNSVTLPLVVIRPILFTSRSVNQR